MLSETYGLSEMTLIQKTEVNTLMKRLRCLSLVVKQLLAI